MLWPMARPLPDRAAGPQPVDPSWLRRVGRQAGLSAVGITSAEVLEPARSVLPRRREAGLSATMAFTYRNPARSTDPGRVVAGARSMVVGLWRYPHAEARRPDGLTARVARYARADAYGQLRVGLGAVAAALEASGWRARVVADSNELVDRNAAWRAGLGWYGKNTNILAPEAGSWFVLGAVVTDADLGPVDEPLSDGCGGCTACLDGCPTGALVAPGVLDARRCIAWLVQAAEPIPVALRPAIGDRIYGCDICQEVCPENREPERRRSRPGPDRITRADDATRAAPAPASSEVVSEELVTGQVAAGDGTFVELAWVLEATDGELLDRFGRWYIANRDPDVIRRTALVVVGNVGRPDDPVVAALLERYLGHPNPLLRAHALWAARRLGRDDLAGKLGEDLDPLVATERRALVPSRVTLL